MAKTEIERLKEEIWQPKDGEDRVRSQINRHRFVLRTGCLKKDLGINVIVSGSNTSSVFWFNVIVYLGYLSFCAFTLYLMCGWSNRCILLIRNVFGISQNRIISLSDNIIPIPPLWWSVPEGHLVFVASLAQDKQIFLVSGLGSLVLYPSLRVFHIKYFWCIVHNFFVHFIVFSWITCARSFLFLISCKVLFWIVTLLMYSLQNYTS